MFLATFRTRKLVENGLDLLDAAIGFGLISGAALAMAVGKFMLTGILVLLTLGIALRFIRRGRRRKAANQ